MKWKRVKNGGWLQDKPSYESEDGVLYIAQDYDSEETAKLVWFLHDENGMIGAFDTLKEAKEYVG